MKTGLYTNGIIYGPQPRGCPQQGNTVWESIFGLKKTKSKPTNFVSVEVWPGSITGLLKQR